MELKYNYESYALIVTDTSDLVQVSHRCPHQVINLSVRSDKTAIVDTGP